MNKALNSYIDEVISNNGVDTVYGSVRLDDDDCLSSDYALSLLKYMKPEFAGFPVSFPYGYQGVYKEGVVSDIRHLHIPKIALGLSLINFYSSLNGFFTNIKNVYMLGNHTVIDQKLAVLMDSTKQYYFRTLSGSNDSGEIDFHTALPKLCNNDMSISRFGFLNIDLAEYSDCHKDYYTHSEIKKRMSFSYPPLAKVRSDIRALKESNTPRPKKRVSLLRQSVRTVKRIIMSR